MVQPTSPSIASMKIYDSRRIFSLFHIAEMILLLNITKTTVSLIIYQPTRKYYGNVIHSKC